MARITKIELQQINARLAAENAALRAELSQLRSAIVTRRAEPQPTSNTGRRAEPQPTSNTGRRAKLEALKAFATKFHCPARLRDGVIELYSKKRACWVTVPEGAQP